MVKYVTVMCSCLKGVKINLGKTYYSIRYYDIPNASGHNRLYWLYLNCNSIYERRGWGGGTLDMQPQLLIERYCAI